MYFFVRILTNPRIWGSHHQGPLKCLWNRLQIQPPLPRIHLIRVGGLIHLGFQLGAGTISPMMTNTLAGKRARGRAQLVRQCTLHENVKREKLSPHPAIARGGSEFEMFRLLAHLAPLWKCFNQIWFSLFAITYQATERWEATRLNCTLFCVLCEMISRDPYLSGVVWKPFR